MTSLPPFTTPFVQIADIDTVVTVVTSADRSITMEARPMPAWPTTHDKRRYKITPQILSRQPNRTPLIQPNFGPAGGSELLPVSASPSGGDSDCNKVEKSMRRLQRAGFSPRGGYSYI